MRQSRVQQKIPLQLGGAACHGTLLFKLVEMPNKAAPTQPVPHKKAPRTKRVTHITIAKVIAGERRRIQIVSARDNHIKPCLYPKDVV